MKLYAISDLHLANRVAREALAELPDFPDDWLILAGDVSERLDHLAAALELLKRRFARLVWVPGNHDLWTIQEGAGASLRGETKYLALVELCRSLDVLTPEDAYPIWTGEGPCCVIAPLFLLYDYSFRPDDVPLEQVVAWALEEESVCSDEFVLHPDPYPSRQAWCAARCDQTELRLAALPSTLPTILINHFPLRRDLLRLFRVPRFSPWCGTRRTEDWHQRFRALVVVSGHQHVPCTLWRDGVRFEEVSLGYPRQWSQAAGIAAYLRQILPAPEDRGKRGL